MQINARAIQNADRPHLLHPDARASIIRTSNLAPGTVPGPGPDIVSYLMYTRRLGGGGGDLMAQSPCACTCALLTKMSTFAILMYTEQIFLPWPVRHGPRQSACPAIAAAAPKPTDTYTDNGYSAPSRPPARAAADRVRCCFAVSIFPRTTMHSPRRSCTCAHPP